jgi:ABC-type bacteriocin/lantibiotic exporter with double-glycine peptidase domain
MKTRKAAITIAIAAAALGASAAPAFAQTHTPFVVQDNGGALVTQQSLTAGQVIYSNGIAYHVTNTSTTSNAHRITLNLRLPASDNGRSVVFSW